MRMYGLAGAAEAVFAALIRGHIGVDRLDLRRIYEAPVPVLCSVYGI